MAVVSAAVELVEVQGWAAVHTVVVEHALVACRVVVLAVEELQRGRGADR